MTEPIVLPAGACDTHLHFYDSHYPVAPEAILHPPDARPDDYRAVQAELGLDRLVVVQPTTYGLDNTYQLQAMAEFEGTARGVMVVDDSTGDDELKRLTDLGVCGARFHMLPGGAVPWAMLDAVAEHISPFGWHIQLQLNGRELHDHLDQLLKLPVGVVIDHIGRFMPAAGIDHSGFIALLQILDSGRGWVKLSAPYESSTVGPPGFDDLLEPVGTLVAHAPDRLLWATNWPHPGQANPPSPTALAGLLEQWLPDIDTRHRMLVDNPAQLYGF